MPTDNGSTWFLKSTWLVALSCVGFSLTFYFLSMPNSEELPPARMSAKERYSPRSTPCRETPFRAVGHLHYTDTVRNEDLLPTLCAAAPIWSPPTVPTLFHELILWGKEADFTKEMVGHRRRGDEIVEVLLSDAKCKAKTSVNGGDYLIDSPYGIRVVELASPDAEANRGEAHFGQLLKVLGEANVASNTQVRTSSGRSGQVSEIFQDAVLRFSFSKELEFITCAMVYWLPEGQTTWTNEFGNSFSYDTLMIKLLDTKIGKGACGGCHLPYAVSVLLSLDSKQDVLTGNTREAARDWLKELSKRLEVRQATGGGWDKSWAGGEAIHVWGDTRLDHITITGHHLEWIAIAPPDCIPNKEIVRSAVRALAHETAILVEIPKRSFKTGLPSCHAARALVLLSGVDPVRVFKDAWDQDAIAVTPNSKLEL